MGALVDLQADHVLREADVLPKPLIVGRHQALPERRAPLVAAAVLAIFPFLLLVVVTAAALAGRAVVKVIRNGPVDERRVDLFQRVMIRGKQRKTKEQVSERQPRKTRLHRSHRIALHRIASQTYVYNDDHQQGSLG